MSLWLLLVLVCGAGGAGGLMNSFLTDRGLVLPTVATIGNVWILYPGFLGNIFSGACAAGLSWLLYGPWSQLSIGAVNPQMTLAMIGGAVVVGMAGSGWLSNAVGKSLFQAVASHAAGAPASPEMTRLILTASPVQALDLAQQMQPDLAPVPLVEDVEVYS